MGTLINIFVSLCAIFPVWFVTIFLGFVALVVIFIVIKIVAFVLDALPFV